MIKLIDRDQVRDLIGQGALLIEALPPKEFNEDHLPGAISLPLRRINKESAASIDRNRPVIVYCWDSA